MTDNIFGVSPDLPAEPGPTAPSATGSEQDPKVVQEPAPEPSPAPPADEPAPEPVEDEERDFLAEDPNQGFRLGNKTYRDLESADHVFRQFAGRAKAEAERRKAAEEQLAELRAERDRLAAAFEMARSQQPQKQDSGATPAEPPAPPKPTRLTELVSDEELDALIAEHGPGRAFKRFAELVEQRQAELLEEATRDSKPIVQERRAAEAAAQTFESAAALKDESGNPVYPELSDPNSPAGQAVFNLWQRNFKNPQLAPLAFTPTGIEIAINAFRAANGQPAPVAPRTAAGAAVVARRSADASLQSMGTGTRSSVRPGGPGPVGSTEERVQRLIRSRQHEVFGVAVE